MIIYFSKKSKELKALFSDEFKGLTAKEVTAYAKTFDPSITYTHPHYIDDNEYIPYGEDIKAFLEREIAKEIIRYQDAPQLGYEILPSKYFYQYEAPKPIEELLNEFWALEKEAESMLIAMGKELA